MSSSIPIILVRPQLGDNIGAVSRVMGNFGFCDLRLVAPRDGWMNENTVANACKSASIVDSARVFTDLGSALYDVKYVFASSARPRNLAKECVEPSDMVFNHKTALLFGCESSGLSNEELIFADCIVTIPTVTHSSLNISHAVAILCYEAMKMIGQTEGIVKQDISAPLASKYALSLLFDRLEDALAQKGFFRFPEKRTGVMQYIKSMLGKKGLTDQEVGMIYGIINSLSGERPP